jgi:pimeloyl-ACP methyl ester carboxylesterase
MVRRAGHVALALSGLVVAYLGVAGWLLHRGAVGLLTVGNIAGLVQPAQPVADPMVLGYRGDPRQAFGLDFETVAVATPLGPAPAWYVPGTRSGLAAIYVHGVAGAREDGYRHLSMLAAEGVPTLLIGYRNDPDAPPAPGGRYAMGTTEWADLDAAVAAMVARGHDRLLLVGESMGGAIVGQFLRRSALAGHVAALALDSPALDFHAVLAHLAAARGLPAPGAVASVARWILDAGESDPLREAETVDAVAGFDGPLFLAHGSGDRIVPVATSERLLARRGLPTHHLRTGADHLQSWHADPVAYRAAFAAFLAALPDS